MTDLDIDSEAHLSINSPHKLVSSQQIINAYADEILENCSESEQTVLEKFSPKLKGSVDIYDELIAAHRRHSLQDKCLVQEGASVVCREISTQTESATCKLINDQDTEIKALKRQVQYLRGEVRELKEALNGGKEKVFSFFLHLPRC